MCDCNEGIGTNAPVKRHNLYWICGVVYARKCGVIYTAEKVSFAFGIDYATFLWRRGRHLQGIELTKSGANQVSDVNTDVILRTANICKLFRVTTAEEAFQDQMANMLYLTSPSD